ncbi:MAG: tyrosine--tRNA ligase [Acidobacteria bacterium]|nr:tyrosine--tRNA ligase [Acidobacteriota bacterium]MCG2815636.1 tyrosine--tRNA ligase [Candidatus Aminicenantes bacterium]
MSEDVFDVLQKRGLIAHVSDEAAVRSMLSGGCVTFYVGFDGTATSLHAGSLVPIMAMKHLQKAGHRPIAIIGGGTTMVGDPSGKTDMRKMLIEEDIRANGLLIQAQLDKYLHFDGKNSLAVNNADWLLKLNYITFLREIGRHFSVNRMLASEAYKQRMEKGLTFLEFNYQLLQAYDYLHLYREYGCTLQMGGDDQWGNILAGVDLIRREEGAKVEAMTFPLLTASSGAKMGKTAKGAIWLDGDKLSPYDFYQYWVNCDDSDAGKFLRIFTFLPLDEISDLENLLGSDIRRAKQRLAYEATAITHGKAAADEARTSAEAAFGEGVGDLEAMPSTDVAGARLQQGLSPLDLFVEVGLVSSRGEAKRLQKQGGMYVNDRRIDSLDVLLTKADVTPGGILLRAGKKKYHRVQIRN